MRMDMSISLNHSNFRIPDRCAQWNGSTTLFSRTSCGCCGYVQPFRTNNKITKLQSWGPYLSWLEHRTHYDFTTAICLASSPYSLSCRAPSRESQWAQQ